MDPAPSFAHYPRRARYLLVASSVLALGGATLLADRAGAGDDPSPVACPTPRHLVPHQTQATASSGRPAMTSYGVDEYELEDLKAFAEEEGMSLQDAVDRWGWQNEFSTIVSTVADRHPGSFSHGEVKDSGAPGGLIHMTDDAPPGVAVEVACLAQGIPAPIAVVTDATYTESEQGRIVGTAHDAARAAARTDDVSSYYDTDTGTVGIAVGPSATGSESSVEDAVVRELARELPSLEAPEVDVRFLSRQVSYDE